VAGSVVLAAYAVTLVLWFVKQPSDIQYAPWSTTEGRAVLADWGVPVTWWIAYLATLMTAFVAVSVGAAVLILRARLSWFRLYVAFVLVLFATAGSEMVLVFDSLFPELGGAGQLFQGIAWISLYLLAYVFPDGRFVPDWTRWFAIAFGVYLLVSSVTASFDSTIWSIGETVLLLTLIGSGVASQIYRYARVSSRIERQQTRWVVAAFALWFALGVGLNVTPLGEFFTEASPRGLATFAIGSLLSTIILALIPIAITVAILRYRLYDIDIWINRTLLYATLTAFIIGIYALVVTLAGRLWAGGDLVAPPIAAAIVALSFNPVRVWVQHRVNRIIYGERDDPYQVLSQLGQQMENRVMPEAVAPAVVATVERALKVPYAAVVLGSPGTIIASSGREVPEIESFDLRYGDEVLGALVVGQWSPGDRFSSADRRLLTDLARHSGVALHAAQESLRTRQLAIDLQQVREHLVTSREEERRRIRRDLHDSLGPALSSQSLTIDVVRSLLNRDIGKADILLHDLKTQSQEILAQVRQLARELRPPVLDELGLSAALEGVQEMYRQHGLEIALNVSPLPQLSAAVEVAAYRIVEEAVTNVFRHSDAPCCEISVGAIDGTLVISISDSGAGIQPGALPGVGTASMRERAEELGGSIHIESNVHGGTRVEARLPVTEVAGP
jgi:two-component system, NarL family, sensor kinase